MIGSFRTMVTRRVRHWLRTQPFSKRQQFVGITFVLTVFLMATQIVPFDMRYPMIAFLAVASYFLCAFGLRDDLKHHEWFTLLVLPVMFTTAMALFYFLLPTRWLTRVPIASLYAIGMYALLLTENIYNVAVSRTIALLRAAHTVGFLLSLITFFLLAQTILAYRLYPWMNTVAVGVITYPLVTQLLWAVHLEQGIGKGIRDISLIATLICAEVAWAASFLPIRSTILTLLLTTWFYALAGMGQQYLADRLYRKTIIEFVFVVGIVSAVSFLTINWRPGI